MSQGRNEILGAQTNTQSLPTVEIDSGGDLVKCLPNLASGAHGHRTGHQRLVGHCCHPARKRSRSSNSVADIVWSPVTSSSLQHGYYTMVITLPDHPAIIIIIIRSSNLVKPNCIALYWTIALRRGDKSSAEQRNATPQSVGCEVCYATDGALVGSIASADTTRATMAMYIGEIRTTRVVAQSVQQVDSEENGRPPFARGMLSRKAESDNAELHFGHSLKRMSLDAHTSAFGRWKRDVE